MTRDHLTIVTNGEVYNFLDIRKQLEQEGIEFRSQTDTEVILRAYQKWGINVLHQFNGMFAIAIWDDKEKTLILARDRIGIKPLYYYKDNRILLFGSEVQALMHSKCIPAGINWEVVYHQVLVNSYYHHDHNRALVKDVFLLPPGHFMRVKPNGQVKIMKYWGLPESKVEKPPSQAKLVQELRELLEDSIKFRLVSDVPVAAFLSGGVDSSVINVLASRLVKNYKLTAVTVTYEGGGKDIYSGQEDQDLEYSRIVAKTLKDKIDHKVIEVKPADISLESIDEVIDLASFSDEYRYLTVLGNYRTVKELGFKVILNGQGADEIMGGYISINFVIKTMLDVQQPDMALIKHSFPYMSIPDPNTLNEKALKQVGKIYDNLDKYFQGYPGDLLEKMHRYLVNTGLQKILKFEDFLSMHSSVECRVPFLDHRIIEWAFKIPFQEHIRVRDRMGKILLRRAAKDLLTKEVLERPKQVFPDANQQRLERVLRKIFKNHHSEIIKSEIIRRLYKKNF
ncbi:MAG: asparagine synthase (glutamine-hydrolyzing) [Candidatus Aminicenantes bacterium]|nr:MAG: asparagine synthase (glutamine-hydrolyzing) [Candidatus Aminicenantes bacterium]